MGEVLFDVHIWRIELEDWLSSFVGYRGANPFRQEVVSC